MTVLHTNMKLFVICLFTYPFFSGKNTIDNHLSTFTFVHCRLLLMLNSRNTGDIDNFLFQVRFLAM